MSDSMFTGYCFGPQPPEGVTTCWGARAIAQRGCLDILGNRASTMGAPADVKKLLSGANKAKVLRKAIKAFEKNPLSGHEQRRVVLADVDGYVCEADTRASYGYVYLCIYKRPEVAAL